MPKQLRELLTQIDNKKSQARDLVNKNDLEGAKKLRDEAKELKNKYDLLLELADDEEEEIENQILDGKDPLNKDEKVSPVKAFTQGFKALANKVRLNDREKEVINATTMTEGVPGDGGLTVPQDLKTEIKELRKSNDALENYVNIETVTTLSGSRVIEVDADDTPFDNIDEAADFPDMETPTFANVKYSVKKKGGILKVTQELFSDTAANIQAYLKKWIAKKSRATRNHLILKALNDNFSSNKVTVTGIDDLKDIFNVKLDTVFESSSIAIMNQDAFNVLDKLKDADGEYILQKDPTEATKMFLFGKYQVVKMSNKTIKTTGGKALIYCGDLKEAITIFDREVMTIDINDRAGNLWDKDLIGMKVRERIDIQKVDGRAVVIGEITIPGANPAELKSKAPKQAKIEE